MYNDDSSDSGSVFKELGAAKKVKPSEQLGPRRLEDYQKLRKNNPSAYYRPSVQQRMVRDAQTLGDEFYSKTKSNDDWWNNK